MRIFWSLAIISSLLLSGCGFYKHTIINIPVKNFKIKVDPLSPPVEVKDAKIHIDREVSWWWGKCKK